MTPGQCHMAAGPGVPIHLADCWRIPPLTPQTPKVSTFKGWGQVFSKWISVVLLPLKGERRRSYRRRRAPLFPSPVRISQRNSLGDKVLELESTPRPLLIILATFFETHPTLSPKVTRVGIQMCFRASGVVGG